MNPSAPATPLASSFTEVTTLAGNRFKIRPITSADAEGFEAMIAALSPADRRFRFFSAIKALPIEVRDRLTNVDHVNHEAFVALRGEAIARPDICGVVRLIRDSAGRSAEFAIVVAAGCRGIGLGYSLMQLVIAYAKASGIETLSGKALTENRAMLKMCRELGFACRLDPDDSTATTVSLAL